MHRSIAKHLGVALAVLIAFAPLARADYLVKDGNGATLTIKSDTEGSAVLPAMTPVDANFNPFGVPANPFFIAQPGGTSFNVICISGCPGSSGGDNVNLTGINGSPPAIGNPLFIGFGTGVTLPPFASPPTFGLNTTPSNANGNGVIVNPLPATARHFPGCTVGTSSASCLAASTAVNFLQVQNTSVSASIACAFGSAAVLNSSGSFQLGAGQSAHWGVDTAGVPSGAMNCIASAGATPLYVEWN